MKVYTPRALSLFQSLLLLAALVLGPALVVSLPGQAFADEDLARQRFIEGRDFFQNEEYLLAAERFREAYELSGRSALLYNVGQAYRRANLLSKAEEYFQQYLTEQPDAPNAEEVVETIIEIQREQAARMATVRVTTRPDGAQIFVGDDHDPRCTSPCSLDLSPGDHTLRALREGYLEATTTVSPGERETLQVNLALEQAIPTGRLRVHAEVSGARLLVGGQSHALPMTSPIEVEAGRQEIQVERRSETWTQVVTIEANETLHVFSPVGSGGAGDFSPFQVGAIGLGGASLGLGFAAVLMGGQTRSTHEHLQRQQALSGSVEQELLEQGRSQRFTTNMLWIGSALSLAAGAGLFTFDLLRSSQSESIEPSAEPASGLDRL